MGPINNALIDLGGVVYLGDRALPGAVEAIGRLREAGIGIRFLTNSTRSPRRKILEKLASLGLDVARDELFTPALAARKLLESRALIPHLLIHPDLEEDFAGLPPGKGTAVVVGDAGEHFTYAALNAAFRALGEADAFFALANNRSFRDSDGGLSLDAGPFVAALEFASDRVPVVLGKPSAEFFGVALKSLGCEPENAAMIGDDAENDVGGALAAGMAGILVRTGKYAEGDEDSISPAPSAVANDLPDAANWIIARSGQG